MFVRFSCASNLFFPVVFAVRFPFLSFLSLSLPFLLQLFFCVSWCVRFVVCLLKKRPLAPFQPRPGVDLPVDMFTVSLFFYPLSIPPPHPALSCVFSTVSFLGCSFSASSFFRSNHSSSSSFFPSFGGRQRRLLLSVLWRGCPTGPSCAGQCVIQQRLTAAEWGTHVRTQHAAHPAAACLFVVVAFLGLSLSLSLLLLLLLIFAVLSPPTKPYVDQNRTPFSFYTHNGLLCDQNRHTLFFVNFTLLLWMIL